MTRPQVFIGAPAVLLGAVLASFGLALLCGQELEAAARIGIAARCGFGALGHLWRIDQLLAILPGCSPLRRAGVLFKGMFEASLAVVVLCAN